MTLFLSFWFFSGSRFAVPRGGILVDGSEVGEASACLKKKTPPGLSGWGILARAVPPWRRNLGFY